MTNYSSTASLLEAFDMQLDPGQKPLACAKAKRLTKSVSYRAFFRPLKDHFHFCSNSLSYLNPSLFIRSLSPSVASKYFIAVETFWHRSFENFRWLDLQ